MYNEVTISMTISRGEIKDFPRGIRLHQGWALNPQLFNQVFDVLTKNDIVLIDRLRKTVNFRHGLW